MNKKQIKDKMEQLEQMLSLMKESMDTEEEADENGEVFDDDYVPERQQDREKDYIGNDRRNLGCTVPYWILDYYFEVLIPKFEGRIKPYHRKDLTPADIVRHLLYAAMLNPESVPLSTYDDIKHLKD